MNTLVNPFCLTFLAKIDVSGSAVSSESKASDSLSNYSSHTSILLIVLGHTPRIDQSFYCELRVVGLRDFVWWSSVNYRNVTECFYSVLCCSVNYRNVTECYWGWREWDWGQNYSHSQQSTPERLDIWMLFFVGAYSYHN